MITKYLNESSMNCLRAMKNNVIQNVFCDKFGDYYNNICFIVNGEYFEFKVEEIWDDAFPEEIFNICVQKNINHKKSIDLNFTNPPFALIDDYINNIRIVRDHCFEKYSDGDEVECENDVAIIIDTKLNSIVIYAEQSLANIISFATLKEFETNSCFRERRIVDDDESIKVDSKYERRYLSILDL